MSAVDVDDFLVYRARRRIYIVPFKYADLFFTHGTRCANHIGWVVSVDGGRYGRGRYVEYIPEGYSTLSELYLADRSDPDDSRSIHVFVSYAMSWADRGEEDLAGYWVCISDSVVKYAQLRRERIGENILPGDCEHLGESGDGGVYMCRLKNYVAIAYDHGFTADIVYIPVGGLDVEAITKASAYYRKYMKAIRALGSLARKLGGERVEEAARKIDELELILRMAGVD